MKRFVCLLFVCLMFGSCAKSGSSFPAGTSVTYEVSASNDTIAGIGYWNATQSVVSDASIFLNNWSLSFQTTKDDQVLWLHSGSYGLNATVTGKIYVDGTLEKQATGTTITLTYP